MQTSGGWALHNTNKITKSLKMAKPSQQKKQDQNKYRYIYEPQISSNTEENQKQYVSNWAKYIPDL